jgi:hypothetical protein
VLDGQPIIGSTKGPIDQIRRTRRVKRSCRESNTLGRRITRAASRRPNVGETHRAKNVRTNCRPLSGTDSGNIGIIDQARGKEKQRERERERERSEDRSRRIVGKIVDRRFGFFTCRAADSERTRADLTRNQNPTPIESPPPSLSLSLSLSLSHSHSLVLPLCRLEASSADRVSFKYPNNW